MDVENIGKIVGHNGEETAKKFTNISSQKIQEYIEIDGFTIIEIPVKNHGKIKKIKKHCHKKHKVHKKKLIGKLQPKILKIVEENKERSDSLQKVENPPIAIPANSLEYISPLQKSLSSPMPISYFPYQSYNYPVTPDYYSYMYPYYDQIYSPNYGQNTSAPNIFPRSSQNNTGNFEENATPPSLTVNKNIF